jgi:hypothetical protein
MNLIDQAVKLLIGRGFPMLPSTGASKKPCVNWKEFQKRLPTADQLREWDRKFHPEKWGLVTGALAGIVVVDFDGAEGTALMRKWGIEPHVRTGSGGYHWYLRHPGWRVPTLNAKTSKRSWPWKGLDVRGDGGFAVLLGSNKNGPYVQLRELVPDAFDALPEEVRDFLRNNGVNEDPPLKQPRPAQQPAASTGRRVDVRRLLRDALEIAPKGRNDAGFWLACQLRDNGYISGDAEAAMRNYQARVGSMNAKRQREPYTVREAMASLREAYSRPAREPWEKRSAPPQKRKAAAAPSRQPDQPGGADVAARKQTPRPVVGADEPESISLYVGHTGEPLVGHLGEPLSRSQYSRVPREVSGDRRLKPRDVRVYGVLAGCCWQGSTAQVGKRLLAKLACCAERLIIASLKKLEATGHIKKHPVRRGKRGRYVLLSSVFGQKQRAGVEEVVSGPHGQYLATVRKDQGKAWNSHPVPLKSSPRAKERS